MTNKKYMICINTFIKVSLIDHIDSECNENSFFFGLFFSFLNSLSHNPFLSAVLSQEKRMQMHACKQIEETSYCLLESHMQIHVTVTLFLFLLIHYMLLSYMSCEAGVYRSTLSPPVINPLSICWHNKVNSRIIRWQVMEEIKQQEWGGWQRKSLLSFP